GARRRADDHRRADHARRRQAPLRRVHEATGARARRRAPVDVRDVHRLPRQKMSGVRCRPDRVEVSGHRPRRAAVAFGAMVFDLEELKFSPTASLFEGFPRAGIGISVFVVRTPPGKSVELHVHPYSETFVLLEGSGRWTAGDEVVELRPNQMLVVPPETPHGFRNTGEQSLLVVSVHESGTLEQTFLGRDPL